MITALATVKMSILTRSKRALSVYLEFARVSFLKMLAYRLRYYMGIVTYLVNVTVYYFIWKAIYASSTNLQNFNLTEIVTYIAVGWIVRTFYFNNIDRDIAAQVAEGRLATDLTKPVNLQMMYVSQAIGESAFRALLFTVPTATVIVLVFPVKAPAGFLAFAMFLASAFLALLIFALINFLVGLCAVRLKSILGLIRAKYFVIELLSGLLIPITFFPPSFQKVFAWLPFQHITWTPLTFYLGKARGEVAILAMTAQVGWVIVLWLLGHWFWSWNAKKISIQGG